MSVVAVQPELIRWARERAGLEPEELTHKFPRYPLWEGGEAMPTMRQLEKLARATRAPLGYFFLPEPPQESLPVRDFRTIGDEAILHPSPELIDTIQLMQQRQDWLREYLVAEGEDALPFVGSIKMGVDIIDAANRIRKTLNLEDNWARKESTWKEALQFLRRRIESSGIIVVVNGVVGNNTKRILQVKEFRGFVLSDDYAPFIFVNSSDAKAAQMFTLAHELSHVWLGEGGIFNLPHLIAGEDKTEKFCNAVAAEFLVPMRMFGTEWEAVAGEYNPFDELARRFKISQLVVARRALDLGYINKEEFFAFYREYIASERRKKEEAPNGGNFFNTQESRIGRRFGTYVVRAAREGRLLYREAYHLTGLHGETFARYASGLGFSV